MNIVLGVSASTGIGIGKAFVLPEAQERIIPKREIEAFELENGWTRFTAACAQVQHLIDGQLATLAKDSLQHVLFETYQLMLADPVFTQELHELYLAERINIEFALEKKIIEYADRLRNSGNDYLSERAQDIEDVFGKVQDCLLDYHPFNIEDVPDNVVLVASSIRPSDAFILNKRKILGLALTEGGTSSHVAILARSFGIPAVVGLEKVSEQVTTGDEVVVDGILGEVVISPDAATVADYMKKVEEERHYLQILAEYRDKEARTKDGTRFNLMANIGTPEEADSALAEGADGIGLFRTEFLFMNALSMLHGAGGLSSSNSVTEDAQFEAYKYVLEKMGGRPVTIRTLDAGGDKLIDMKNMPDLHEHNPLMGLRAIRLSLYYPQVFRTQLRALYRASVYGNLRILLPLITDVTQVDTIKGIARGVRLSLKEEGIPFREDVPIGIMVETAAAAITSDCLAKNSAFFSIGTNDLVQYTLGIDRENPSVAPLYNEYNLAVIRLLRLVVHNAWKYDVPLSVCGEMAGRKEWLVKDGKISLWIDNNDYIGPHTMVGKFINNSLQIFYFFYYLIPYISMHFLCLLNCLREIIFRFRHNGAKSSSYKKTWNSALFVFGVYLLTCVFVFFVNTLVPATSPRKHLKNEFKHTLSLSGFGKYLNKKSKDERSANSFPSGHVAEILSIGLAFYALKIKFTGKLIIFCSFLIGISTLFLRYHYLCDIIMAIFLAFLSFGINYYIGLRRYKNHIKEYERIKRVMNDSPENMI